MVAASGITSLVRLQGIRSAHIQTSAPAYTHIASHFVVHGIDEKLVCLFEFSSLDVIITNTVM